MRVKHKFYALRFVASLYIFFGGLLCIVAVVIFFSGFKAPSLLGIPVALLAFWLFIGGLMMMVVGELCYVFLGIEENTRITNELLKNYHQNKAITPAEKEQVHIRDIIKDKSKVILIALGILIIFVIVISIPIQNHLRDNINDTTQFNESDEVSENEVIAQSDEDSTLTKEEKQIATNSESEEKNIFGLPSQTARQTAKPAANVRSEEQEYIKSIELYDFQAKYFESLLEGKVPGVKFKLRNNGNRSLKKVEVTVYFKDASGNTIYEENFLPVNTSSWFEPDKPLKPQYIWQMERDKFYSAKNAPDEWQEGNATANITAIEFEE